MKKAVLVKRIKEADTLAGSKFTHIVLEVEDREEGAEDIIAAGDTITFDLQSPHIVDVLSREGTTMVVQLRTNNSEEFIEAKFFDNVYWFCTESKDVEKKEVQILSVLPETTEEKYIYPEVRLEKEPVVEPQGLLFKAETWVRRKGADEKYYLTKFACQAVATNEDEVYDFLSFIHKQVYSMLILNNPITESKLSSPAAHHLYELDKLQASEWDRVARKYNQ